MTLDSPLSIGSGENESTDHDVIVDASGNPFIPATAIAGVLRSSIDNAPPKLDDSEKKTTKAAYNEKCRTDENALRANKIFGYVPSTKELEESPEFKDNIIVYDAINVSSANEIFITMRDSVKLKNKVGVNGAKFDMQAVEPGVKFVSYIELLEKKYVDDIENSLAMVDLGLLRFGTKTSRGYGKVKLNVKKQEIKSFDDYCDFAVYNEKKWEEVDSFNLPDIADKSTKIKLSLKCKGGISIREYSTDIDCPDYETISIHNKNGKKDIPVIPGTSWAGAFRSRFEEFIGESDFEKESDKKITNALFGFVNSNEKDIAVKSAIIIPEIQLKNGTYKESTRNSIDRFSGATKDKALYTEKTYYNGETELEIIILKKLSIKEKFALAATFADLHNGFLAVGGLTSIGRGLFNVTAVNGSPETAKLLNCEKSDDLAEFIKEVFPNED